MIDGYWTALATIMIVILLMTGWSSRLNKQINLMIVLPSILFIWIAASRHWNLHFELGKAELTINASYIMIGLLLCVYRFTGNIRLDTKLVMLYSAVLCLALAMIRALMLYAPWAGANISYWHLPIVSGALLAFLQFSIAELALILYCGTSLSELLLMWQQRGEYNGEIATLQWWDFLILALASIVLVKLLLAMLHKGTLFFVQLLGNRMKS